MKIKPRNNPKYKTLTHAQKRIYYDEKIHPSAPWANIGFLVKYKEAIDLDLIAIAINKVVMKNEGLRLRMVEFDFDPEPYQYVSDYREVKVDFIDFTGPESEQRMREWIERRTKRPFDILDNDLFYFSCIKINENQNGYYMKLHHTIADGWSCLLIFSEIDKIYEDLKNGTIIDETQNISYINYIRDEKEYLNSEQAKNDQEFWHDSLLPLAEPIDLAIKKGNPDNIIANNIVLPFPSDVRTMMHNYCKANKTSLYKIILSALTTYISKVTGLTDIVISGSNHNRTTESHKKMVGMFVSTILMRLTFDEDITFEKLVENAGENTNTILKKHQRYPFDLLAGELRESTGEDIGFLRNISLTGHSNIKKQKFDFEYIFPGFEPGALLMHLNLSNKDQDGILEQIYVYQIEQFDESDVRRIHLGLINILRDALNQPEKKIWEIEFLSNEEKKQVVYGFNQTKEEYPRNCTIHEVFESQVEKTPNNIALVYQDKQLTYRGFNERANQLATFLREKGVQPDSYVGLMVDRSLEMLIGMMGILKAGGAYLPIEPDYPHNRVDYMLKDSDCKVILTQTKYLTRNDLEGDVLNLNNEDLYKGKGQNLSLVNTPKSLAYSIYTSGSTGKPKGVMIEHDCVINMAFSQKRAFGLDSKERIFQFSSVCFDASVEQIYIAIFSGAALIIIDKMELLDESKFHEFIFSRCLTHIHAVPSFVSTIPVKKYPALKRMIAGGDACPSSLIHQWTKFCDFCNEYGPTETTVTSIQLLVNKTTKWSGDLSIGKALDNTYLYVLDKHMRPVPVGVPGELFIGGDGVARGYLNRPELTEERFLPDLFVDGGRMYRTGDLVRWLPDGNIDFLGRIDFQVKIRGFRIETGEIENKILDQANIKEAIVVARDDRAGEKFLCAYITSDEKVDITSLCNTLSKDLPEYMIPAYFVQLDKMPLNPNGKIDRKKLPAPEMKQQGADYIAPRNTIEERLADIWSEVLHIEQKIIGIDDDFFKLGGHSLKAAVMITQIHKSLNVKLLMHEIFDMPTIRKLANLIAGAREEEFISIELAEEKEYYLQTSAQKRMFFIEQLEEDSVLYNIQLMDVYCKGIDKAGLEMAFKKLIERHESLRTSFFEIDGVAVQKIHDYEAIKGNFEVEYYETGEDGMIFSNQEGKEWTRITGISFQEVVEHFVKPFNLAKPPLIRVGLIKIWGNTRILMLDMHHIISDGVSNVTLIKDLWDLYDEEELPELRVHYRDFSEWGNKKEQLDKVKSQEAYWLKEFEGEIPVLSLPCDYRRPSKMTFEGDMIHFEIDNKNTRLLNIMAQKKGNTLYMILFTFYNILLSKLSGQEDIIVGTVTAGRGHADLQPIVGMFVDTLAMRNYPAGNKTFFEFLEEIKKRTLASFENQNYPFEELVSKVATRQDKSRNPLFDVVFTLDNEAERSDEYLLDVLLLDKSNPYGIKRSKFDLMLMGAETGEGLQFNLEYNTQLFKEETVERFTRYFKQLVSAVCRNSNQKLSEIDILPEDEKCIILYAFNNTVSSYPWHKSIHELFEEQVQKTPESTAVVFYDPEKDESSSINYIDLNRRVNRMANLLREKGTDTNSIVGMMAKKSIEMIVGVLATLKAGGAYLPLNPDYPVERKEYIVNDCSSTVLLTNFDEIDVTVEHIIHLDNCNLENYSDEFSRDFSNDQLAYIMYTSGSTGKPKGVMVEHMNVVRLVKDTNYVGFDEGDKILQTGALEFDASTFEIWGALLNGLSIYLISKDTILNSAKLKKAITKNGITTMWMTAPLFNQMLDMDIEIFDGLKYLLVGGDVVSPAHVNRIRNKYSGITVINGYGPTENTTFSVTHRIEKDYQDNIPIGEPIANSTAYILDKTLRPVPVGVVGELYVGGHGVSRGYLNNPEMTDSKFITNPFVSHLVSEGEMMYATGDLARWLPNGSIEFLGRIDFQVKIRGFRIEPGEVENHLMNLDIIDEASVIARKDRTGANYLCAYFVPSNEDVTVSEIKKLLMENLPGHMIPSYFMKMTKLPLTSNGKVDRRALPEPQVETAEDDYVAPTNDVEKMMAEIWQTVLAVSRVSIKDNFFDLGGDSIKTILVSSRLQKKGFGMHINELFLHPTIEELSKHIKKIEDKDVTQKAEEVDEASIIKGVEHDYQDYLSRIKKEHWTDLDTKNHYGRILLTGATGFLGSYLLQQLLERTNAVVLPLVRGDSREEAELRLIKRLDFYFGKNFYNVNKDRIVVINGDLRKEQLGMETSAYQNLSNSVDAVLHSAANVKHYGAYEELHKDNVEGTIKLLDFALSGKKKDFHHISTLSVSHGEIPGKKHWVFTEYNHDVGQQSNMIYAKSKLEAEKNVLTYRQKGLNTSIYRAGNLTFNSESGQFQENIEDNVFYAMIKAIIKVGFIAEKMKQLVMDLSFIDCAAKAIVSLLDIKELKNETHHIANPYSLSFEDISELIIDSGTKVPDIEKDKLEEYLAQFEGNGEYEKIIERVKLESWAWEEKPATVTVPKLDRTVALLEKINFEWPKVNLNHIEKMIDGCKDVGFL